MLKREPNVVVAEVEGERRLLNLASWTYLALNETGERIWQLLESPADRSDLLRRLAEEYDAPREAIGEDLDSFLEQLHREGFLVAAQ